MSAHVPLFLEKLVRKRSAGICEYCLLPQRWQEALFHVDHIRPRKARGPTTADNLALACVTCSLRKAARTRARDPKSGELVALFHPRQDRWAEHFRCLKNCKMLGRSPTGRATIAALGMNRPALIAIRKMLVKLGLPLQTPG
jgi:hypothetical protein